MAGTKPGAGRPKTQKETEGPEGPLLSGAKPGGFEGRGRLGGGGPGTLGDSPKDASELRRNLSKLAPSRQAHPAWLQVHQPGLLAHQPETERPQGPHGEEPRKGQQGPGGQEDQGEPGGCNGRCLPVVFLRAGSGVRSTSQGWPADKRVKSRMGGSWQKARTHTRMPDRRNDRRGMHAKPVALRTASTMASGVAPKGSPHQSPVDIDEARVILQQRTPGSGEMQMGNPHSDPTLKGSETAKPIQRAGEGQRRPNSITRESPEAMLSATSQKVPDEELASA